MVGLTFMPSSRRFLLRWLNLTKCCAGPWQFLDPKSITPMEIYRVMDRHGKVLDESQDPNLGQELVTRMYTTMVQLQAMDNVLYEAQRQGRISFYMTNYG